MVGPARLVLVSSSSPRVLITGATDGLGLALARLYREQGAEPALIGRQPWTKAGRALTGFAAKDYCQADLSSPAAVKVVTDHLAGRGWETLDLLIHNAAVGYYGPTEAQSPESIRELAAVNLWAPVALTHALLPRLEAAQGRGKVAFIGSVVAALPCPTYGVYGATKAALASFAANLRLELAGKVGVQVIHPGPLNTDFHTKAGVPPEKARRERFPSAERTAAATLKALGSRRAVVVLGLTNKLAMAAGRICPGLVDWGFARWVGP